MEQNEKKKRNKKEKNAGRMARLLHKAHRARMARHDTAAIRQARAKTRPAHAQGHATVRAQGLASGVCRDTILCNVTGGAGLESRYKAPGAATRAAARATWRSVRTRQGLVLRYKLCIVTGGADAATRQAQTLRHDALARACSRRHSRTCLRHGREGATIRPSTRPRHGAVCAAWTQCACSVHVAWAMGVCTVHSTQF